MMIRRHVAIGEYGVLVLAPAIVVLAGIILFALLGIFVIWLVVFWLLAAEVVTADLVYRYLLRPRPTLRRLSHDALPAGQ